MNDFKKLKRVKQLSELKENGIIDDIQFESQKDKILNSKSFWSKKNIGITCTITVILVAIAIVMYVNYVKRENDIRATQAANQKFAAIVQKAKENLEIEENSYKKINNDWNNMNSLIIQEDGNFNDSAFGGMKYVNMPDHAKDWIKQLDIIKENLSKFVDYTNQLSYAPAPIPKDLNLNSNFIKSQYELRFNDFSIIIKNYNKQIDDYNNWATGYIKLGGKADYLDSYIASAFSKEIDFNSDGKFESLEELTS